MSTALASIPPKKPPTDNWDTAGDEMSPVRGPNIKFDAGAFFIGKEKTLIEPGRKFVVTDRAEGWQFLKKDCQPEWVMRTPSEPKPERPFATEDTWPIGLNDKPEHPWKYTLFIYLIDAATGESLTFSSNTTGGRIGIDELTAQIRYMRNMQPGAVPIITLDSRMFNTKYGKKPRPHFKIEGWKVRDTDGVDQPKLIADADNKNAGDGTKDVNDMNDEIPF